jgi:hypothetical protein
MSDPAVSASISCSCAIQRDLYGRMARYERHDCEMHGDAPEAVAARARMQAVEDMVPVVESLRSRITRALAMLDGLRREHEPDCAKERARPGLENFCCCMFGGADEHNAKLDAVRDVLRGGTEGGR